MSWSITTASSSLRVGILFVAGLLAAMGAAEAAAQEISVPASVSAGSPTTISTSGSGTASLYLVGAGIALKRQVNLGEAIHLSANDLKYAGEYLAIVCSEQCQSAAFTVTAGKPATLAFLVHPSRVPVGQGNAVSGVTFLFDKFDNLVLGPMPVNFQVAGAKENLLSRQEVTHDGEAWFRTNSGKSAGPVHLTVSAGGLIAKRVLQQVASEPCNLRIRAEKTAKGIEVVTDPVHDCAGNPVADGTIVTFTGTDPAGKISIDAPIKGDVARARVNVPAPIVLSAACGVALGNELHIDPKP